MLFYHINFISLLQRYRKEGEREGRREGGKERRREGGKEGGNTLILSPSLPSISLSLSLSLSLNAICIEREILREGGREKREGENE